MGVIGLWSLINDAGTKANVDSLQGTVLAIGMEWNYFIPELFHY